MKKRACQLIGPREVVPSRIKKCEGLTYDLERTISLRVLVLTVAVGELDSWSCGALPVIVGVGGLPISLA